MRILIAEDERELARGLKYLLEKQRFSVDLVSNGEDALTFLNTISYDGVILDIMMPGKSGLEVLKTLRDHKNQVPVMMLTAKAEIEDRVMGLEMGADDYLPKPFAGREFTARVKALVRRSGRYVSDKISFGQVTLDCSSYQLLGPGGEVRLNNKEFQLAELFFRNPHFVFSTDHLMDQVWGCDSETDYSVVWTYIGFLRRKFKHVGSDVEIHTVRGAGYSLEKKKDSQAC